MSWKAHLEVARIGLRGGGVKKGACRQCDSRAGLSARTGEPAQPAPRDRELLAEDVAVAGTANSTETHSGISEDRQLQCENRQIQRDRTGGNVVWAGGYVVRLT